MCAVDAIAESGRMILPRRGARSRGLLSLLLAAYFGLAVLLPLLPGEQDAGLPVCCRRHGAHHCMMMMMAVGQRTAPGWRTAPCPLWPHNNATVANLQGFAAPLFSSATWDVPAIAAMPAVEEWRPFSLRKSGLGVRGPPARDC